MVSTYYTACVLLWLSCLLVVDSTILFAMVRRIAVLENPTVFLITLLMFSETLSLLMKILVQYTSQFIGHLWIGCPGISSFAFMLMYAWLSTRLLYPLLGTTHIIALYKPKFLEPLTPKILLAIGSVLEVFAFAVSVLYFVDCNIYLNENYLWEYNNKSQVASTVKQSVFPIEIICALLSIVFAALMIAKLIVSKYSSVEPATSTFLKMYNVVVSSDDALTPDTKVEIQFAVTFCFMALIITWSFVGYRFCDWSPFGFCWFVSVSSPFIRNMKGLVYLFVSKKIRTAVLETVFRNTA